MVDVQGKQHEIKVENLRVCSREHDDGRGLMSLSVHHRVTVCAGLVISLVILILTELALRWLWSLRTQVQDGVISMAVPGRGIAIVGGFAPFAALSWAVATIAGCYRLHNPIQDPEVRFMQISELACGRSSATVLYRIGFSATAALLGATVLVHQEIVLPHLPGGRDSSHGENFTWYALLCSGGVAVQGVFVLQPSLGTQTVLHLVGTLAFFYGAWCSMGAAQKLYLPHYDLPPEDDPGFDEISLLVDAAAASKLLAHPLIQILVHLRHSILMRAPMAVFIIPIFSQFADRAPVKNGSQASSPATRSLMGLAQWLVVLNFGLIFLSFGPELSVASMLPMPLEGEE